MSKRALTLLILLPLYLLTFVVAFYVSSFVYTRILEEESRRKRTKEAIKRVNEWNQQLDRENKEAQRKLEDKK